ncbi:MAG: hypothetical protein GX122_07040 [Candidatus Cloacimonetes bacterium]|nr:hypothetical protein [Candidatus Cloacimonadota bacterium]
MVYRLSVICLFSILLIVSSCNSVKPETQEEPFSIEISLKDSSSKPLHGYKVSIFQKDYKSFVTSSLGSGASTIVRWTNADTCRVEVLVKDYFGNIVRKLLNEVVQRGDHTTSWDAKNDAGENVRDGIYKIILSYYNVADSLLFSKSSLAYKFGEFLTEEAQYITNHRGMIVSDDIVPFPVLYCTDEIRLYDVFGRNIGGRSFSNTSNTMVVLVSTPDGEETRQHFFNIKNGRNRLDLNWDLMNYSNYDFESSSGSRMIGLSDKNDSKGLKLLAFTVSLTAQHFVKLNWITEYETGMIGFRIYRSQNNNQETSMMITPIMIPATNNSSVQTYVFEDREVEPGTYYYWLEAVDYIASQFYGPVRIYIDPIEPPPAINSATHNYPNPFNCYFDDGPW